MSGHVNDHMLDVVKRGHINDGLYSFFGGGSSPLDPDSTLFYDFAGTKDLIDEVSGLPLTFTRASSAWHYDSAGLLVEAVDDEPRFDHDQSTRLSLGLLIEEARTNLALWSRNGAQSAWIKDNVVPSVDQVGITGVSNSATRLTATAANATILQTVTAAAVNRAFSIYLRRVVGTGPVQITQDGGLNWIPVAITGQWQRFSIIALILNPEFGIRITTSGDEVAMDVAQLEVGDFASSPIITAAASVTRALERSNTTDMSWFNAAASTWYAKTWKNHEPVSNSTVFGIDDGSTSDNHFMRHNSSGQGQMFFTGTGNNGLSTLSGAYAGKVGQFVNAAAASQLDDAIAYWDGVAGGADNVVDIPIGMSRFSIGAERNNQNLWNGHIAVFAYANVRKSNAFLQDLTTS